MIRAGYALYHGEDILIVGSIDELAAFLGVKQQTIYYYGSPSWKRKSNEDGYLVIKLDDEEEE